MNVIIKRRLYFQHRLFSTNSNLVFAKRLENAEGQKLKLHTQNHLNVYYNTFWNDFGHLSYYSGDNRLKKCGDVPLDFTDSHFISENSNIFAQKENFIEFNENKESFNLSHSNKVSTFKEKANQTPAKSDNLHLYIPQDFNLDINTKGEIKGNNLKDTKLIGFECSLVASQNVAAKRLRFDKCVLESQEEGIHIDSYVESGNLLMKAKKDITVRKKMGIGKIGLIQSTNGSIRIGNAFALVDKLKSQEQFIFQQASSLDSQKEQVMKQLNDQAEGLFLKCDEQIIIDHFQGLLKIKDCDCDLNISNVELAQLLIDINGKVTMNMKGIHDSSYIKCKELSITINSAETDKFLIFDELNGKYLNQDAQVQETKPVLFINCEKILLKRMSSFDILQERIRSKAMARQQLNKSQ